MPRLPVEFHPEALVEARAAYTWYRERNPSVAAALMAEIDRAIAEIAEAPERWPRHVRNTRRFLLHSFPFSVVYRILPAAIQVVAFAHGRRRPGYWKRR